MLDIQGRAKDCDHIQGMYAILAASLVAEDGQRLFADAADAAASFGLSFDALNNLSKEVLRVSGIGEQKN